MRLCVRRQPGHGCFIIDNAAGNQENMTQQQTRLKICGITNLEDARYAAGAMVDYLGFIFYPGSSRYVRPREAAEIIGWIEGIEKVGVFVNQSSDEINRVIERTGIDLVQLHGDEEPGDAVKIAKPVIKSFRISENEDTGQLIEKIRLWDSVAAYFLFDAFDENRYGGTGKSWDWSILSDIPSDAPVFLAGGISSKNVEQAVSRVRPFAVDISSSIESEPGIKDFDKMQVFLDRWNEVLEINS